MYAIFDLDGVLIDSEAYVRDAYAQAGVTAPENVLSYEGIQWLTSGDPVEIRARKNVAYLNCLRDHTDLLARVLPPFSVACTLEDKYDIRTGLYTGAPVGTLAILKERLPAWPFRVTADGVRTPTKMALITTLYRGLGQPGVYIDDQARFIELPPGWTFIHYTGQSASELLNEVLACKFV